LKKELSEQEIDLQIRKSISKLVKYYEIFQYYRKFRYFFLKINSYIKKRMWYFIILYTLVLIWILR